MRIVHVCLSGPFYEGYAYQDNLLPKYHKRLGHDVAIIAPTFSRFDDKTGRVNEEMAGETTMRDGVKLIRIPAIFPYRIHVHFHLYRYLGSTITALNPDLIFVHSVAKDTKVLGLYLIIIPISRTDAGINSRIGTLAI